ncbi:MAG: lipopolysaccharide assembly protein LapB [Gammaproteobacteria bacterium]|nr:MAG: lipopolysaccharide assembly protein LapB [Gammaproteobacteria bacterium]
MWLILLAALGIGWLLGRHSVSHKLFQQKNGLSTGYVEGLNYLLNEQPDRAIDVLVSMVEVDSEAVETHLALGTLFRNQGEVERAIRIHQNLIARPTLSKSQRMQALMNLGLDYKQAGINDRAVVLFEQLALETGSHRDNALENLLEIYQYEKEWLKAIDVARKASLKGSAKQNQLIGHFYAELAEQAITTNDLRGAAKMLRHAKGLTRHSARYLLLQFKLAQLRGKYKSALRWLEEIISHCPEFRTHILDDLEACYGELGLESLFLARLKDMAADSRSGLHLVCRIADIVQAQQGKEAALALLEEHADRFSAPLLSAKILTLINLGDPLAGGHQVAELADELVVGLASASIENRCNHCGFEAKERHWCCPGCGAWDSLDYQEAS